MRYFICILGSIVGVLVTLLLVVTVYLGLREVRSLTDEPLRLTMQEAVERAKSGQSTWVWLTDARADCTRSVSFIDSDKEGDAQNATLFVASNEKRDIEVVADVRDLSQCGYVGNVHYAGMLKKMDDNQRKAFASRGLALPVGKEDAWWLCGYCRPGDEWPALIITLLLTVLAGWLTVKVYRARIASVQAA